MLAELAERTDRSTFPNHSALTSDGVDRCDAALHHVVQVEHLVLQAGGDHRLPVAAELSSVDGEALQVDALDFGVGLPVHLQRDTETPSGHMVFPRRSDVRERAARPSVPGRGR